MWRMNAMIFARFGRFFKFDIYKCKSDQYEWVLKEK